MFISLRLLLAFSIALALPACVSPDSDRGTSCAEGSLCDDGDPCTLGDRCSAGVCSPGAPLNCSETACRQAGACDRATGACIASAKPDGTPCDDLDLCSSDDACVAGECVGTVVDRCSHLPTRSCFSRYTCDPPTGLCVIQRDEDGTPCDDADVCTVGDVCTAGICESLAIDAAAGCMHGLCFVDATVEAGLDVVGGYGLSMLPAGAATLDYDGDGDFDLFFAGYDLTPTLLENDGLGHFVDVSLESGVRSILPLPDLISSVTAADHDGDGDPDLYLGRVFANRLLRNDGGRFTDVTATAGVGDSGWTSTAVFFDFDRDGWLDLFVGNYITLDGSGAGANHLYRNRGDGTFDDVTATSGIGSSRLTLAALPTDYDDDGDLDLMICNDAGDSYGPNRLFRFDGETQTFTDVGPTVGADLALYCMGIAAADADRDGDLDYFFTNLGVTPMLKGSAGGFEDGVGSFIQPRGDDQCLTEETIGSWAAAFEDFDNDGWEDLFVSTGSVGIQAASDGPSLIYRNTGAGLVEDPTAASLDALRGDGRGAVFGDFDGDGDMDVVQTNLDGSPVYLRNTSASGHGWVRIHLEGVRSPRSAIGARVTARVAGRTLLRELIPYQGHASTSETIVHLGIGAAAAIDELEIRWPSGTVQRLHDVFAYARLELIEPAVTGVMVASSDRPERLETISLAMTLTNETAAAEWTTITAALIVDGGGSALTQDGRNVASGDSAESIDVTIPSDAPSGPAFLRVRVESAAAMHEMQAAITIP